MAQQHEDWTTSPPLVLLGIRSSLKSDLGSTSVELVYGTSIYLLGEIPCSLSGSITRPAQDYAAKLRDVMSKSTCSTPSTIILQIYRQSRSSQLYPCVRPSRFIRRPLQPPCEGPYEVLRCTRKTVFSTTMVLLM